MRKAPGRFVLPLLLPGMADSREMVMSFRIISRISSSNCVFRSSRYSPNSSITFLSSAPLRSICRMEAIRSSRSSPTVAETNFSGIFCESISTTVSARYTVGSKRTTATATRAKRIHATVIRIFLFQIVLRMERRENAGWLDSGSSSTLVCPLLTMVFPAFYRNIGTKRDGLLFSTHCAPANSRILRPVSRGPRSFPIFRISRAEYRRIREVPAMWPRRLNKNKASDAITNNEISPIPWVGGGRGRSANREQGAGYHRRPSRWARHRTHSAADDRGRLGRQLTSLRAGLHRAGQHDSHRWLAGLRRSGQQGLSARDHQIAGPEERGFRVDAACPPGRLVAETLVTGYPPRRRGTSAPPVLPG